MAPIIGATGAPFVIVLLLLTAIIFWLAAHRRCVFRIMIERGEVTEVRGRPPERFISEVNRLCRFWKIEQGWIKGVRRGTGIAISVGGGIDGQHAQVFRNAWNYPLK